MFVVICSIEEILEELLIDCVKKIAQLVECGKSILQVFRYYNVQFVTELEYKIIVVALTN